MRITRVFFILFSSVLLTPIFAHADHSIDLYNDNSIPERCQVPHWENGGWYNNRCGAAVGQMTLEGYPNGVNFPEDQEVVWRKIQSSNVEGNLYWTDPIGLRTALRDFGPGADVNWVIFSMQDPAALMFNIAYWMEERRYPVPVLTQGGHHWVLITGLSTDESAVTSPSGSITIQHVDIIEPEDPPCSYAEIGGTWMHIPWTAWSDPANAYWDRPVDIVNSQWKGNYVAVIEPPLRKGTAATGKQASQGALILAADAMTIAQKWLDATDTSDKSHYKVFHFATPLDPLLVNSKKHAYYLVRVGDNKSSIADGAILVNAYSGELQEIAVFSHGRKYLSRESASSILASYLKLASSNNDILGSGALIFEPSDQIQSRLFPAWRFFWKGLIYYVTQKGEVVKQLGWSRGGN